MAKTTPKTKAKPKTKEIQEPKPEVKTPEQVKLEEELLAQVGVKTINEDIQETTKSTLNEETPELSANGTIQEPKPEDDTNVGKISKEPVTKPETHSEGSCDYFIATHTIKANGTYYNAGDKVPKV